MIAEQVRAHDFLHEIQGRGVQQQVSPQAPPLHLDRSFRQPTQARVELQVQSVVDEAWDEREEAKDIGQFDNMHLTVEEGEIISSPDRILEGASFNRETGHREKRGEL